MAEVHRFYRVLNADLEDARALAEVVGELTGMPGAVLKWFDRVNIYDENATQEQIDAGTALPIGRTECGGVPEEVAAYFSRLEFEPEQGTE